MLAARRRRNSTRRGAAGRVRCERKLGNVGTRVFYTSISGFDTHAGQAPIHAALWKDVSESVAAFFADLREHDADDDIVMLIWTEFGRSDDSLVHLMEEALAALGPAPTAWRARLLTRLASELCWASDPSRAEQLSAEAVDTARRSGDGAALASALLGRLLCASGPDHLAERRPMEAEILALSEASGDREPAVNALMWQVGDALQLGDAAALRAATAALVRSATDLRQPADL